MKEENPSSLIKKTLFGRKSELKLLFDQLNLVKEGYRSIIHISGAYGSGKSKLLSTFYDSIESDATLFLRGQFSQNIGNSPKDAFIQAIRQFAKIILTKPEQEVNAWKIIMKEALQVTSKSLIKMIPDLEVLVDKSNPGDFDRSININFPFTKLIKSIPSIHNPLVLVIENLQYADKDSWDTLQTLIKDRTIKYFLLITTSDAELDDDHFRSYLDQIKDYEHISLANYTVGDIQESLTELRFQSPRMLAEILHTKTAGFPQSLSYLLERLIHRKEISYDETSSEWGWSSEHLQTMASIEQGTGLLVQLYKGLTPNSQKLYQYAALLGNEFSIQHLHEISQRSIREIVRILEEGIADNLVQQNDKEFYQFVSPKFLEIILDRLDTTELGKIHLEIANQFLEGYKSSESISIFQIAYHYNAAESILPQKDLDRLVMVNEMAGREALNSAAFDYALDHFSKAIDYLPAKAWDEDYQRTFKIYLDATFAASISNHVDKMESWMDLAMTKAKNIFDRVSLYEIKLDHLTENHKFPETVQLLQRVLKEIGYPIKRNPSLLVILKEFLRVMIRLRGRHPHALLELPEMTNQKALAFMRLTVNAATSIFGSAPDILPIVFFRQVRLSLKYGNSKYSPFAYVSFGFALTVFLNQLVKGYNFGTMALRLVDQLKAEVVRNRVLVTFYAFLSGWKENLRASIDPLEQAFELGQKKGDYLYMGFASYFNVGIRFFLGDNLNVLSNKMSADNAFLYRMNQELIYWIAESQRQMVLNFIHAKEDPTLFDSDGFDEKQFFERLEAMGDEATKFDIYASKLLLACYFNQFEKSLDYEAAAQKFEEDTTSRQINFPSFLYSSIIAIIKNIELGSIQLSGKIKSRLKKRLKLLSLIAKHAPDNYENKHLLAQAWMAKLDQKPDEAEKLFIQSIEKAKESSLVHEEALAREHLAQLYTNQGKLEFAELMYEKAYESYRLWGADAKCQQMEKQLSETIAFASHQSQFRNSTAKADHIDLEMILSTHKVLAAQESMEDLLKKAVEIILKSARITKCLILFAEESGELSVKVQGNQQHIKYYVVPPNEIEFPNSLLMYSSRVKRRVVSENILKDLEFTFDPYWKDENVVSTCVIPLVSKNELLGMIYFENNILEGAFDHDRIEFFETVATQLTTSMESLLLSSQIEKKIAARTIQLSQKNVALSAEKEKSDRLIQNILPSKTAEELKNKGQTSAVRHDNVSVLFLDIVNFTALAEELEPEQLLEELNTCFKNFDQICIDHNLEKIKTIGDAYMAASGLTNDDQTHLVRITQGALAMRSFIQEYANQRVRAGKSPIQVRIGIHVGPVVAGVVGLNKFHYDIWGDTVNIAARLQQHAEPNQLNISAPVYTRIKDQFDCSYRGKISVKNKGEMEMYLVDDLKN